MEAATSNPADIRAATIARALHVKQNNAATAACAGSALAGAVAGLFGMGLPVLAAPAVLLGLCGGVLYANAFEYALHRFFLHRGGGELVRRHAMHHDSTGAPEEARYVNFATSPWVVVLVFGLNALPVFAAVFLLQRSIDGAAGAFGAGVFGGFTIYFILYEEVHWRIHLGGWLPRRLGFARAHHLRHHGDVAGCYNVFLPLFDWLVARLHGRGLPGAP